MPNRNNFFAETMPAVFHLQVRAILRDLPKNTEMLLEQDPAQHTILAENSSSWTTLNSSCLITVMSGSRPDPTTNIYVHLGDP